MVLGSILAASTACFAALIPILEVVIPFSTYLLSLIPAVSTNSAIISAYKVKKVIDTTGAGDAFSAGFIFRFVQHLGYDFKELKFNVEFGNLIAGRCIQKLGARKGIPSRNELMTFVD